MTDPVPHNRSRLGYVIGLIFHPFVIFIPTLFVVLKDVPLGEALAWMAFLAVVILVPALVLIQRARRREQYTYQRATRHHIYIVFWSSMVVCVVLAVGLGAPRRLVFSLLCLCVWVPAQYVVNARYTKISAHTAVVAGIASALVAMGELDTIPLVLGGTGVVLATAWARMVTGHHTLLQVSLGIAVSAASVLVTYGMMFLWLPL